MNNGSTPTINIVRFDIRRELIAFSNSFELTHMNIKLTLSLLILKLLKNYDIKQARKIGSLINLNLNRVVEELVKLQCFTV